jgi:hypothetical protein
MAETVFLISDLVIMLLTHVGGRDLIYFIFKRVKWKLRKRRIFRWDLEF